MQLFKRRYSVSRDHKISIQLPDDIEPGEHEFIIIVDQPSPRSAVKECNPMDFSGTLEWSVDGLEYQRQCRGEWE